MAYCAAFAPVSSFFRVSVRAAPTFSRTRGPRSFSSSVQMNQADGQAARVRTALVTGSTDGIGLHTAKQLASNGWRVLLHGRRAARVESALRLVSEKAEAAGSPRPEAFIADLSSRSEVEKLAREVDAFFAKSGQSEGLDVLVNNAGVFEKERKTVCDGALELTFTVNVLAPFLLSRLLVPALTAANSARDAAGGTGNRSRILNISSISHMGGGPGRAGGQVDWDNLQHEKMYDPYGAYSLSKLLILMISYSQASGERGNFRSEGNLIDVVTLDPGTVSTKMLDAGWGNIGVPIDSADDELVCATSSDIENGLYYVRRRPTRSAQLSYDVETRAKLWDVTNSLLQKWD